MRIDPILGAAMAIIFFGLALALPQLSSDLLYDFTALSETPTNILRVGLIVFGFYFLDRGLNRGDE